MFFKKKIIEEQNPYDKFYHEKWIEALNARESLSRCATDVIIKNGVIDLYPDGADKEFARLALKNTKYSLLCAIGEYDSALAQLEGYYTVNCDKLEQYATTAPTTFPNSHEVIEGAYKDFYKKN